MATTLLATQVPIPVVNTTLNLLEDAENTTGINGANVLKVLVQGTTSLSAKWNRNALAVELIGRLGCGTYCILNGLTISTGTGLSLGVAAGQAAIDGVVEIDTATTYTVPASQAYIGIWLKQDGTLTHSLTTTPPSGGKCYLGSCVTSGSAITSVDFSGVLYSRGAIAVRTTADTGVPGDSPAASLVFITYTAAGAYIWNGTSYNVLYTSAQLAEVIQDVVGAMATSGNGVDLTYSDAGATLTADINITEVITTLQAQQVPDPAYSATLSGNVTLTLASQNIIAVDPNGSNRKVLLPASPGWGNWFRIINKGSANSIIVKDSTDATTIATLTTGQYVDVYPVMDTGATANWPSSITPITMGGAL